MTAISRYKSGKLKTSLPSIDFTIHLMKAFRNIFLYKALLYEKFLSVTSSGHTAPVTVDDQFSASDIKYNIWVNSRMSEVFETFLENALLGEAPTEPVRPY